MTLLEPLAEELSVSIGELLSCRVPAAEEREQPMTEEKRKETVQTDESLQAVVEISKDTVQQKRRDIRRLITGGGRGGGAYRFGCRVQPQVAGE